MELVDKAKLMLNNCLSPKRSDRMLILCDLNTMEIGQTFFRAAQDLKLDPILVEIPLGDHHGAEPPVVVADIMIHCDVIVAPTTYSITYTNATRAALARGARVVTMPGMTMNMLEKGGLEADYEKIAKAVKKFGRKFSRSRKIRVTSPEGTDIEMSIEGREWIVEDTGLCQKRGSITNLPAGEVFIAPVERSAEGTIIMDGAFMGALVERVEMEVRKGMLTKVKGNKESKTIMDRGRCARTLCEFGIGMNPSSGVIGNILEDQKAKGTVHFGFGDNSTFGGQVSCDIHVDGMVLKPTVLIDGDMIVEKGRFILEL
ncbi:MAG: aminopeptidase [Thermoplasmatota archaeon]